MKDRIRELIAGAATTTRAALLLREYLQARVLEALQRSGVFERWAFLGGTALRFLYALPRFSEDLDFSWTGDPGADALAPADFERTVERVQRAFEAEAYEVDTRMRSQAAVKSAFIGFPGLPYELGLPSQPRQKVAVKIEIDTNPPAHAKTATSLIRRHVLLNLLHYDKPSLLSGKVHALIQRPWVKGRDVYDLVWYLSDPAWPGPNVPMLRSSLAQTGMSLSDSELRDWRGIVADRIAAMDWGRVVADVRPFLERADDLAILTREGVLKLLRQERR